MPRPRPVATIARCAAVLTLAALPAGAQSRDRFALRVELGAGAMLSAFQRNDDPAAYNGDAKGYGLGLHGALRLAWAPADAFALQLSLSNWAFPSGTGAETGWVFAPMVGARIQPRVGRAGRLFVDGNVGLGFTGEQKALQVDVGLGFEFDLGRTVSLGPVVRYGQTVQPDTRDGVADPYPDDARYLVGGLSLSWHSAEGEAPTEAPPVTDRDGDGVDDAADICPDRSAGPHADPTRRGCPLIDTDGDGLSDADDLCPDDPPGEHPDDFRRGCPMRDRDHDGVGDDRDVCVDVPQGAHADPMRPGCPDPDADHDGVLDHDDACPEVPAGPLPDPNRAGCPDGDRDGDGYVDSRDRCPDQAETFNNVADEDGCPEAAAAPMVEIRSGMIELQGNPVNFVTGSDHIVGRRSFEILDALVAVLRAHGEITRIDIQGHTDDVGSREANIELSARRARAVRTYLVDHGVLVDRVVSHGLGPDRPIADNATVAGRATNRRVEVHIVSVVPGAATQIHQETPAPTPAP